MSARVRIPCLILVAFVTNIQNVDSRVKTKIIGGSPVDIKHRPFMLSLHDSQGFTCGASILSPKWGITALHCLDSESITNYYVRAGSNNQNRGGSLHRLTKMYTYNSTAYLYGFSHILYHDIALFEVQPLFRYTNSVRPARLPSEFSKPPHTLYVCGWGYTSLQDNERGSSSLMGVHVHHRSYEICINEAPEYEFFVYRETHLCYGGRGKDSCYGDSGGPLASKNTIYGIVSFGQDCAVASGIYERVAYYRSWIKEVTNL